MSAISAAPLRNSRQGPDRRLSVAPMMDWTDRHCRYFLRLISRRVLLYTEMVTSAALLRGDARRLLEHDPAEQPLALQLGGSEPSELARCARMAEDAGYREVNLNVGCPSDRVRSGRFGACLMREPALVADCVAAMAGAVAIPVTVKTRLGVDEHDRYEDLWEFAAVVAAGGCRSFIIHARKAWLGGLSPKDNRRVPPLDYERVFRLKRDFPDLEVILNGGVTDLGQVRSLLSRVDGVMIGREAYHNPYLLAEADCRIFGMDTPLRSREVVLDQFIEYARRQMEKGCRLHHLCRHILGLYQGQPGARSWRRYLSEQAGRPGADIGVLENSRRYLLPRPAATGQEKGGVPKNAA